MTLKLPGFPSKPEHTIRSTIGGTAYQFRFVWRDRTAGWYVDLLDGDGTELITGRRLSADWFPFAGIRFEEQPDGAFVVVGIDGYERAELGATLRLEHYSSAEIESFAPEDATPLTDISIGDNPIYATFANVAEGVMVVAEDPVFLVSADVGVTGTSPVTAWADQSAEGNDLDTVGGTASAFQLRTDDLGRTTVAYDGPDSVFYTSNPVAVPSGTASTFMVALKLGTVTATLQKAVSLGNVLEVALEDGLISINNGLATVTDSFANGDIVTAVVRYQGGMATLIETIYNTDIVDSRNNSLNWSVHEVIVGDSLGSPDGGSEVVMIGVWNYALTDQQIGRIHLILRNLYGYHLGGAEIA